ncbi:MAG: hypothetical protein JXA18_02960 [Chitinispirillaceae bacterium]|nr:hypothetical protein [Chitinispirillaceae bacterium]
MPSKKRFFTTEGYKRLEQNPFVDKEMLRFVREKWRAAAAATPPEKPPAAKNRQQKTHPGRRTSRSTVPESRKKRSEEDAVELMTAAIRRLLRE